MGDFIKDPVSRIDMADPTDLLMESRENAIPTLKSFRAHHRPSSPTLSLGYQLSNRESNVEYKGEFS